MDKITNHTEKALSRLPEKNKKPKTEAYILALVGRIQEYEDLAHELKGQLLIDTATGIFLDRWGQHFNVIRGSDGDEVLRTRIKTAVFETTKAGQINVMIAAFKSLIGDFPIELEEYYPNTVVMTATTDLPVQGGSVINDALKRVKAAGIGLAVGATPTRGFKFSSQKNQINTGNGFASSATGSGQGLFAKVIK